MMSNAYSSMSQSDARQCPSTPPGLDSTQCKVDSGLQTFQDLMRCCTESSPGCVDSALMAHINPEGRHFSFVCGSCNFNLFCCPLLPNSVCTHECIWEYKHVGNSFMVKV